SKAEGTDLSQIRTEQSLLKKRLDGAAAAYAQGGISLEQLTSISSDLRKRIDSNNSVLAQKEKSSPLAGLLSAENITERWGALTQNIQREVVSTLFEVRI